MWKKRREARMSDEDPEILKDEIEHLRYVVSKLTTEVRDTDELRMQLQEQGRQTLYWKERAEYWRDLWSRTANRLLQIDPTFNEPHLTVADELKKLDRVLNSTDPNPWKDV